MADDTLRCLGEGGAKKTIGGTRMSAILESDNIGLNVIHV